MRLPFRVALLTVLLSLLTATVSVVGVSSYLNAHENASELAERVLDETGRRIDLWIRDLLAVARRQSALDRTAFESGRLVATDFPTLGRHWLDAMKVHRELTFLSIGIEGTGDMLAVERRADGKLTLRELRRESTSGALALSDYWPEDFEARRAYNHKPDHPEGDPTKRPWYLQAKEAGRPVWTPTYTFIGEGGFETVTGVTFATPIYVGAGNLVGITTADYDIFAISEYLARNPVGEQGFAFVVELRQDGERRIISHPTPKILTAVTTNEEGVRQHSLIPHAELSDRRVARFMELLAAADTRAPGQDMAMLPFNVDGRDFLGGYRRLGGDDSPSWMLCLVLPRAEVMARVDRNNLSTLSIGMGAFLLTLLASVWISTRISRPLRRIAHEAEAVGRFHLEPRDLGHSAIREVDQLIEATEDMKAGLRSFQKFVPADLVRDILSTGQEAKAGGERREISVLFSDLVGFTALAEKLDPEVLVAQLGGYFELAATEIHRSGGTLDKYVGDGVMAFWGAPAAADDHAMRACEAALAIQRGLDELRRQWQREGKELMRARIGINSGDAIVGNIGSSKRLSYTAMGDNVNLASRLEGLGSLYGVEVVVSESTYREVKQGMAGRALDRVSVKGRSRGIVVYELLGPRDSVDATRLEATTTYEGALEAYLARDFASAADGFRRALELRPDDLAAVLMIERCVELEATPPGDDWDGTHRLTSK